MTQFTNRFALGACLLVAVSGVGNAQVSQELDGAWFSGLRMNTGPRISFELVVIDDVGSLKADGRQWPGFGSGTCNYYFNISNGAVENVLLNSAAGNNKSCREDLTFSLSRTSVEELQVEMAPGIAEDFGGLPPMAMNAGTRPVLNDEKYAHIPDLDILGIQTGKTRGEVEERLGELGFEMSSEPPLTFTRGYNVTTEKWSRSPDSEGVDRDHVSVSYGIVAEDDKTTERLAAVSRFHAPSDAIALSVLETALRDKYGLPARITDNFVFLRDGQIATRENRLTCPDGSLQHLQYPHYTFTTTSASPALSVVNTNCAADLSVAAMGTSTGSVRDYRISIRDVDVVRADFWHRWSSATKQDISAMLESLSQLGSGAPDL